MYFCATLVDDLTRSSCDDNSCGTFPKKKKTSNIYNKNLRVLYLDLSSSSSSGDKAGRDALFAQLNQVGLVIFENAPFWFHFFRIGTNVCMIWLYGAIQINFPHEIVTYLSYVEVCLVYFRL